MSVRGSPKSRSPDENLTPSHRAERSKTMLGSPDDKSHQKGRSLRIQSNQISSEDGKSEDLPVKKGKFINSFKDSILNNVLNPISVDETSGDDEIADTPKSSKETKIFTEEEARLIICYNTRSHFLSKKFKDYIKTSPELKDGRLRTETIREIIATEARYVNDLNLCVKVFLQPLRALPKKIIKDEEIEGIFGTIEQVLQTNELLLEDLNKAILSWPQTKIGDVFKKFAHVLKAYTSYINHYDDSQVLLQSLLKSNKKLQDFLEKCHNEPDLRSQQLGSFLVMPVQRIPRYRLLLQELLKRTPPNHVDYNNICVAFKEVNQVAHHVNESKRSRENSQLLNTLNDLLQQHKVLFKPLNTSRSFIKRAQVNVRTKNNKTKQQADVFLFDDTLLLVPPHWVKLGQAFKLGTEITTLESITEPLVCYLHFSTLSSLVSTDANEHVLVVDSFMKEKSVPVELHFEGELEYSEWQADISIQISIINNSFLQLGIDQGSERLERQRLLLYKAVDVGGSKRDLLTHKTFKLQSESTLLEEDITKLQSQYDDLVKLIKEKQAHYSTLTKDIDELGDKALESFAQLEDEKARLNEVDEIILQLLNKDTVAFLHLFNQDPSIHVTVDQHTPRIQHSNSITHSHGHHSHSQVDESQLYQKFGTEAFIKADLYKPVHPDLPEDYLDSINSLFQLRCHPNWYKLETLSLPPKYSRDRLLDTPPVVKDQYNLSVDEGNLEDVIKKYSNSELYADSREQLEDRIKERERSKLKAEEEKKIKLDNFKSTVQEGKKSKILYNINNVDELQQMVTSLTEENKRLREEMAALININSTTHKQEQDEEWI
ncbi:hypothetical protein AKO1_008027 [Acrasis kona]|uniref:DH domain-containing protein n=1 Tax=Acrasis kona TaxID=1008807 RepID=A0AAW2YQV1_9EUKA